MGYFDDIVPPDSASSYFPTPPGVPRITVRPSPDQVRGRLFETGAVRSLQDEGVEPPGPGSSQTSAGASDETDNTLLTRPGLFDDIVPPRSAHASQTPANASDETNNAPLARTGLFDDIVPPAWQPRVRPLAAPVRLAQAPSVAFGDPARQNGTPERLAPLWQPFPIDQNSLGAVASAAGRPNLAAPINPSDAPLPDPAPSAPRDRRLAPSLGEYGITEEDPSAANLWKLPPGSFVKAMHDILVYFGDISAGRKHLPQTFDPSVDDPAADEAIRQSLNAATLTTGTGAKFRPPRGAYVKNVPAPEAAKPAAGASAPDNAPAAEAAVRPGNQDALYNSAVQAFKASDLSNAGRALTKHPEIIGETSATLRQALRTDDAINDAAHAALRDIMRNGVTTIRKLGRFGTVTQIQIPGGFGARWYPDGRFIGFIKPRGV